MNAETFSGAWYIDKLFALRMKEIMIPRFGAGLDPIPAHFRPSRGPGAAKIDEYDRDGDFSNERYKLNQYLKAGGGDVAVIPMIGSMSRFGLCGDGNESMANIINLAATEKAVKAIVIKGFTPGGTVDSTELLANAIKQFPKKKVGYSAGQTASAGVFAMSQCDEIVMEDSVTSEFGSIGVLQIHVDQQAALEKAGLKVQIFRADESVDKARINSIEGLTEEQIAEINADLNACMKVFKGYVRRGRAGKLNSDEVFSGKMYKKKEALALGLVDRIGSLDDAIRLARRS